MDTRSLQVLKGEEENYILPFFWQHGENEATLREYMNVIHNANIGAVCVEARPHPDFAGPKWWQDMDVIIDEAKKLNMKVWILDDAHFPSGQAAGKMPEQPDELCKQYLYYSLADICGPVKQTTLDVKTMAQFYPSPFAPKSPFAAFENRKDREFNDDTLMAVIASKLDGKENDIYHLDDTLLDLTDKVDEKGMLNWDVPEGNWRIFVIFTTRKGGGKDYYINFMSKRSCRVQIDAVYEPHFEHYKDEFGKTIAGFFSDEPEIGNVEGYGNNTGIGNMTMQLPWSEEMPALMEERFGKDYLRKVPALWMNVGSEEFTADMRVGYMDIVTSQAAKNFSGQIGEWCREHGVEYIGHIVEDNGIHTRLGSSQGHFFRALSGQDWSGIDDIGGQVIVGGANVSHKTLLGIDGDGEFFHHVLAKMGTSLADIDPIKKGRTMCELFGAYGWQEGTHDMKYIADHLLVRGINRFVPHAFSPKDFPDFDCPPHFYAHGKNPLYKPFGTMMKYINRIAHLTSGGTHIVSAAVLYHAEADWSGMGYMDMAKPARALDNRQIDFDFVPADVFKEKEYYMTNVDEYGLHINGHTSGALIIPGAGYVDDSVVEFAKEAHAAGFPVYYVVANGNSVEYVSADTEDEADTWMVPVTLDALADTLAGKGICDAICTPAMADIQVYHYEHDEEQLYLVSNESAGQTFEGHVAVPVEGKVFAYDAFKNILTEAVRDENGIVLTLAPYEMAVLVIPAADKVAEYEAVAKEDIKAGEVVKELVGAWNVSFTENENYPEFKDEVAVHGLNNILTVKPDFSGVIRYEKAFKLSENEPLVLTFEYAYESVEVWCNSKYAGERICPPFAFDLTGLTKAGDNELRVEVRTTLERKVHAMTGGAGLFGPEVIVVKPEGLIGKAELHKGK